MGQLDCTFPYTHLFKTTNMKIDNITATTKINTELKDQTDDDDDDDDNNVEESGFQ